jgi:hypothetical protein
MSAALSASGAAGDRTPTRPQSYANLRRSAQLAATQAAVERARPQRLVVLGQSVDELLSLSTVGDTFTSAGVPWLRTLHPQRSPPAHPCA